MKDTEIKLNIDDDIKPMKQLHCQIPVHQRKNVEKCLRELLDQDIIEPAVGPTPGPWINPVVLVPKKQGGVCLCIDMRQANMAIQREQHIMPTLPEIIHDLNGATVFSKLDLQSGYHKVPLHKDSRNITTFSTHKGLFQYKRFSFGINAAAENFQDVIATAIGDNQN